MRRQYQRYVCGTIVWLCAATGAESFVPATSSSDIAIDQADVVLIPHGQQRQFDFWVGDWEVQNRGLQPDGSWRDAGTAHAQVNSVLDGQAILEQWTGENPLKLRGFSLRTYDAEQQRWEIILNWHGGTPSSFSQMVGNFADQRGEFFPPGGTPRTRFTFSRPARDSCQWDQATSQNGADWQTDWVMSFRRKRPAQSLNAENLAIARPDVSVIGQFPETRQLDMLIGIWSGNATRQKQDGTVEQGTAIRRVSSMIDGYGLLQMTQFSWGEELVSALSFNRQQGRWVSVGLSSGEADCHWLAGVINQRELSLTELPVSNNGVNQTWKKIATDSFNWSLSQTTSGDSGAADLVTQVTFRRSSPDGRIAEIPATKPSLASQISTAQALIRQKKLIAAETILQQSAAQYATQPRPRFLLGYVLHLQQKYDKAIEAYQQAAQFQQTRALASYNIACIHALRNESDQAFEHLSTAIRSGFRNFGQIAADSDLSGLRSDARYQKLFPPQLDDAELFVESCQIIHKFVGEFANDQFGWTARRVGDWDEDGVVDFVASAPTHRGRGKVYVYSSRTGELLMEKLGSPGEQFGNSAVGCGDVDGDGHPDLFVGAPNQANPGNAYVFSGQDGKLLHHLRGNTSADKFGYEVSGMGDLDGDMCPDLLVGAISANGKQSGCGKAFVFSGRTGTQLFELEGERTGDNFANAACCTLNREGSHTLAIGAQNAGPGQRGRVYVYRIRDAKAELAFTVNSDRNSVNLGQMFLSFPNDVNQDGFPDLYDSDFSDKTAALVGGKVVLCSGLDGKNLLTIAGTRAGEGLGTSPSDAGDVNGDGIGDLVIGAWQNNEAAASGGKVYLRDGRNGNLIRTWTCRQAGDTFGFDACGIGDVNGDGHIDFLLTSAWSGTFGPKTGRVFIIAGGPNTAEN